MHRSSRISLLVAALTTAVGFGSSVSASEPVGELARITGTAVVNQGAQYVVGREGIPLREGDRLLVLEGGNALVLFADGCQYALQDDELLVVPAVSTCASQAVGQYKVDPRSAIATGPSISTGDVTLAQLEAPQAGSLVWVPPVVAGIVAVAALADDGGSSPRPISP
ncbi:hypothetical protein ABC977_03550 [Thioalkalicoccus limnaeus]|uniref:Uncharacterized protein n=1 Tax=Thioalkalicoccus limnaeus TaxID=120681 RepID=A0ABV4BBW1_9GAMM